MESFRSNGSEYLTISQCRIEIRDKTWQPCCDPYTIDIAVENARQLRKMYNRHETDQLMEFCGNVFSAQLTFLLVTKQKSLRKMTEIRCVVFEHSFSPLESLSNNVWTMSSKKKNKLTTTKRIHRNVGFNAKCYVSHHTKEFSRVNTFFFFFFKLYTSENILI